jgi:nucleoside-diphosphate-sugar epimerase
MDMGSLRKVVEAVQPEVVFHTAVYGGYLGRQRDVSQMFQTNVLGTWNLLTACEGLPIRKWVQLGSSSEYGIKGSTMKETDPLEPVNPYGVSKASATLLCRSYALEKGLPVVVARLFSVYGPYEEPDRFFPHVVTRCLRNQPVELTEGNQTRDFIYIEDVMEGLDRLSRISTESGTIVNLGSGVSHTIREMAESIYRLTESSSELRWGQRPLKGIEGGIWQADIQRLTALTGWSPSHTIEAAIRKSIPWFRDHLDHGPYD